MQGVLTPEIKLWVFRSPGGLQVPTFGSVSFILTLASDHGNCEFEYGEFDFGSKHFEKQIG
jgi:hypothetical protein